MVTAASRATSRTAFDMTWHRVSEYVYCAWRIPTANIEQILGQSAVDSMQVSLGAESTSPGALADSLATATWFTLCSLPFLNSLHPYFGSWSEPAIHEHQNHLPLLHWPQNELLVVNVVVEETRAIVTTPHFLRGRLLQCRPPCEGSRAIFGH